MILPHEKDVETQDLTAAAEGLSPQAEQSSVYVFPASLEQSRYWILDQLDADSTASNMAIAFRLEGDVDDALVERSIRALTNRHEALRTNFQMVDGELSQVISEEPHYSFSVSDLRPLTIGEARQQAETLIHEHGRVRVNLARGPVFFVRLIHVTQHEHFLAFTIHHIACDGWSNGILVRDFAELYAALAQERPPSLPELPFQFADFTVWQKDWLESDAAQSALAFWREHIRRDMPAVDLPTDRPRSAKKSAPGDIESQLLPPELHAKLKAYCRKHDATMHQVLLAAFEGLISRYTDQSEYLLGSTIANRTQPSMEHVVGRFANPQVILADVQGNPTYAELLRRVADWSAKSYAHQDLPFSRLMEEFQLDQAGATSQFLQIYFVYQKAFMQPQQAGALKVVPRPSVSGGVNFDLLVSIVERDEGPRLQIEYNTVLFEKKRIRDLIAMYARVLDAVMDQDTLKVSDFPLLSDEDKDSLEVAGTSPLLLAPVSDSIPAWFDRQAVERGDATVIVSGSQRVNWRSLQMKSLRFVEGLKKLGLEAGQVVALRMEPTADAAAAAIAALRLGAVVLPIQTATSITEWNLILLELQPNLSLADETFAQKFTTVVSFERLARASGDPVERPYPAAGATAWMDIKPEASGRYRVIRVSHEETLDSMLGAARTLDVRQGDVVLVFTAYASNRAWTDLLLPLLAGASTVHPSGTSPSQLQALIDREQVSFAIATPSEFTELFENGWTGDRRLHLVCRGPGVIPANLKRLANYRGRIHVLYLSPSTGGPFAVAQLHPSNDYDCSLIPLAGQCLVVVDAAGQPTPFGVVGELAIRKNESLLRSNFLGRYSPHRGFELVDSVDRLVRIHGYRLRLNDLETILYKDPQVAAVEATILRVPGSTPVLTAYIVGKRGASPPNGSANALLKSEAPGHLASAEILAVDAIPRRVDGSANFSALPRPGVARSILSQTQETQFAPPRDELETKLTKIWEEVLGVHGIGIRNSFFSLGGYSLMIVRLFARINKMLGTSLPITTIFNAPTIEKLAAILRGSSTYSALVPVQPTGSKPPFFLIHSYLIYEGLRSALGEDRPFYGLRELDHDQEMTLQVRAASYVREIRSVQPRGPYYLGGWCAAGPLAVETARQLIETGEEVAIVALFDSWRPGYAEELANAENPQMTVNAVFRRKYRFHQLNLQRLSMSGKVKYLWNAGAHKVQSSRDQLYLRHWAVAQRLFTKFGMPLPHFMHNVSLKTFDSVREYKGKPYPGRITLIRATEAPFFPHADPSCGWNKLAQNGVEVFYAPGTHESMFLEPNLSTLGEILDSCLQKVTAERPAPEPASTYVAHDPPKESHSMTTLADYFDRAYVINLPERNDRRRAITRELDRLRMGFAHPKVELFAAKRYHDPRGFPSPAVRGCFLSHLTILKQAQAQKLKHVLIMEDDLAVSPLVSQHLHALLDEIDDRAWGFIYFGHIENFEAHPTPMLERYDGPVITAHFYAVNSSVFDNLIAYLEQVQLRDAGHPEGGPMHYDGALSMFRQRNPQILTLIANPSLGFQRSSRSDIHGRWFDRVGGFRHAADFARVVRQNLRARASSGVAR